MQVFAETTFNVKGMLCYDILCRTSTNPSASQKNEEKRTLTFCLKFSLFMCVPLND